MFMTGGGNEVSSYIGPTGTESVPRTCPQPERRAVAATGRTHLQAFLILPLSRRPSIPSVSRWCCTRSV